LSKSLVKQLRKAKPSLGMSLLRNMEDKIAEILNKNYGLATKKCVKQLKALFTSEMEKVKWEDCAEDITNYISEQYIPLEDDLKKALQKKIEGRIRAEMRAKLKGEE
jgi:hypothetical protein